MKQTINLYISSSVPRKTGNDEVTIHASLLGSDKRLFEFYVNRRNLARALSIDVAPFYSLGATRPEPVKSAPFDERTAELDAREASIADREEALNNEEAIRI